ncbi:MAG: orotate phosphoribosyltransferase-like protein, partial [Candidatus Thermoplasmatota archaeon]|nr:orotate phosphoribosyltransferase-like protein [Candidatus Thermoplasmatota archaeon]
MPLSIDELRRKVEEYHNKGLNSQQIADELSLSQTTIQWLSSSNVPMDEDTPHDIRVGWRSVAVKAARVEAVSYVFCDIIEEEIGEEVDTMVGISINGIPFA